MEQTEQWKEEMNILGDKAECLALAEQANDSISTLIVHSIAIRTKKLKRFLRMSTIALQVTDKNILPMQEVTAEEFLVCDDKELTLLQDQPELKESK